jgi:hypothetical protein
MPICEDAAHVRDQTASVLLAALAQRCNVDMPVQRRPADADHVRDPAPRHVRMRTCERARCLELVSGDRRASHRQLAAVTFPRGRQAFDGALLRELGFELSQRGHDLEEEPAVRCRRVDGLVKHAQLHAALAEYLDDVDYVDKAAPDPVER